MNNTLKVDPYFKKREGDFEFHYFVATKTSIRNEIVLDEKKREIKSAFIGYLISDIRTYAEDTLRLRKWEIATKTIRNGKIWILKFQWRNLDKTK